MIASNDFQELERAYKIGANDFLRKPFKLEKLKIRIEYEKKTILMYPTELLNIDRKLLIKYDVMVALQKKKPQ